MESAFLMCPLYNTSCPIASQHTFFKQRMNHEKKESVLIVSSRTFAVLLLRVGWWQGIKNKTLPSSIYFY
jgi:hypothetical protein